MISNIHLKHFILYGLKYGNKKNIFLYFALFFKTNSISSNLILIIIGYKIFIPI